VELKRKVQDYLRRFRNDRAYPAFFQAAERNLCGYDSITLVLKPEQ